MQTQVLIIGGGITGAGLARDLALRGVSCIVVEKRDLNAGASGANHGLLHSGARYILSDPAAARECQSENVLLKRLAPHCIEDTGGLFVGIAGDDEDYIGDFSAACARCRIPVRPVDPEEARDMEPALSARLIAAYEVNDAAIDPFRLTLANMADAQKHGVRLLLHSRVDGFDFDGNRIRRTRVLNELTGEMTGIEAEMVVNAAGAWAGIIARMAGTGLQMCCSKGSLLVTRQRICKRVINRLRKADSGDILAPGGTVSILGTTSERVDSPDDIHPEIHEVDTIIKQGSAMIPELADTPFIRAYCGVRPLLEGTGEGEDDRALSRGFMLIDHERSAGQIPNLVTITGGKLTTYRLMAEKTADLVCRKIRRPALCRTHTEPLPDSAASRWTQPGLAPQMWVRKRNYDDLLLCECEMVPQSVSREIIGRIELEDAKPSLKAIALRGRFGKGPCQGTFCSLRLAAFLYDEGHLAGRTGIAELQAFLMERWRGRRSLMWDLEVAQAELLEAMHCGLLGLELEKVSSKG
jgi:glycerol-3-phosphate dehydrogenase